jgi:hypothetical protein
VSEWQPIETADPECNEPILVRDGLFCMVAHSAWEENGKFVWAGEGWAMRAATHWMPLPAPRLDGEDNIEWQPGETVECITRADLDAAIAGFRAEVVAALQIPGEPALQSAANRLKRSGK